MTRRTQTYTETVEDDDSLAGRAADLYWDWFTWRTVSSLIGLVLQMMFDAQD